MKKKYHSKMLLLAIIFLLPILHGCSSAYYGAMEKVGIHKRDILRDRVEDARDSQKEAQQQFKSALEEFESVVKLKNTDLKTAYEKLNAEYEKSEDAAEDVSNRIEKVESVAKKLFEEWEEELGLYQKEELRRKSKQQLRATKERYILMHQAMTQARNSMQPVLRIFRDNVLFLKHNLNAQAIGSLRGEFTNLRKEIDNLIRTMNQSIEDSNKFIAQLD